MIFSRQNCKFVWHENLKTYFFRSKWKFKSAWSSSVKSHWILFVLTWKFKENSSALYLSLKCKYFCFDVKIQNTFILYLKSSSNAAITASSKYKGSITGNYWRNLDQKGSFTLQRFFYWKFLKKSWPKRFFYMSKVLLQKIIEEIFIKNELLLHSESISFDFFGNYFNNNFLTWLQSTCYTCRAKQ